MVRIGLTTHILPTLILPTLMLTAADTIQPVGFSADANEVRQSTAPADVKLAWSLRAQIVTTLVGGMLLVCSIVAGWLWR